MDNTGLFSNLTPQEVDAYHEQMKLSITNSNSTIPSKRKIESVEEEASNQDVLQIQRTTSLEETLSEYSRKDPTGNFKRRILKNYELLYHNLEDKPTTRQEAIDEGFLDPDASYDEIAIFFGQTVEDRMKTAEQYKIEWVLENWERFYKEHVQEEILNGWESRFNYFKEQTLNSKSPKPTTLYFEEQMTQRVRDINRIHSDVSRRIREKIEKRAKTINSYEN